MNPISEVHSGHHRKMGRRKPQFLEIFLPLAALCIWGRSAVSVIAFTYVARGRAGALLLLACSLLYFGFVSILGKWEMIQKDASKSWLNWIKGIPSTLSLGIIAVIIMKVYEHAWVDQQAYALQVLVIVCVLSSFIVFLMKVRQLLNVNYKRRVERQQLPPVGFNVAGSASDSMDGWKSMNPWTHFLIITSHLLDSVFWTWLIIYYRYYNRSLLLESLWIMVSLWLFLLSSWLHSAGVLLLTYRSFKSGHDGVNAESDAQA